MIEYLRELFLQKCWVKDLRLPYKSKISEKTTKNSELRDKVGKSQVQKTLLIRICIH